MTKGELIVTDYLIVATTTDGDGNTKTWRFRGIPANCDYAMIERRALRRHALMFGTTGRLVFHHWETSDRPGYWAKV